MADRDVIYCKGNIRKDAKESSRHHGGAESVTSARQQLAVGPADHDCERYWKYICPVKKI